jgi:hypothetical protein
MSYAAKRSLVDDLLDDFETEIPTGSDRFLFWVYELLFGLEEDEIPLDEYIEGSGEKQLDVIRVEDDTEARKAIIHIIQGKASNGFSANVVLLIMSGLIDVFELNKTQIAKLKNRTLAAKILEIRDILKKYGYGATELYVYYATLGDSHNQGQELDEAMEKIKTRCASFGFANATFQLLGAEELYDLWFKNKNAERHINLDINIVYDVNKASIIEFAVEDYKAVVCTITGHELARLASVEPTDAIFDMNVRRH